MRIRRFRPTAAVRRPGSVFSRGALRIAAVLCAGALLGGCATADTGGGGRVAGDTLSVVSLLPLSGPEAPAARDLLRGQKLALAESGGRVGTYDVNMRVLDEAAPDDAGAARAAARATRLALADSQAIAVIGSLRFESAAVAVPLLNAAGLLHVSPTVGYRGFTEQVEHGEPERWYPSGRRTFHPGGSHAEQAAVTIEAVRAATGRRRPRIAIERESGSEDVDAALAIGADDHLGRVELVEDPRRADAVVYVGDDVVAAEGVGEDLAREAPRALVVYGDDLTRAGLEDRLSGAARRRALLVSRAPRPDSTSELRRFRREYVKRFGSVPGPYAALGHAVMRSVLLDGIARAGARADRRDRVAAAYMATPPELPAPSAFRLRGDRRAYLALEDSAGR